VVGCCSGVAYDDTYGFVGYYVVDPAHRGKGYGLPLFERAMARLGPGRNIGLDGEPVQVGNYIKSGFTGHYESVRFQIKDQDFSGTQDELEGAGGVTLVAARDVDIAALSAYDAQSHATPRPRLLEAWSCIAGTAGFAAVGDGGAIEGYGFMRPLADAETKGWRIGPLVADSPVVAASLLRRLCLQVPPTTALYLDAPGANADTLTLMAAVHATRMHACTRMYTRSLPLVAMRKCFAHLSLEVG
jgi:ribosomal-protein-alanine N-acetyltransferase